VASLTNEEVPVFEVIPVEAEEVMQNRIENPACVVGREHCSGFNGDHDEPENRGDPCLQKIVAVGVQEAKLLDAIVGSLTGDHYIVDMTLAETGAADADETSFLEQVGDGGTTAVAHT